MIRLALYLNLAVAGILCGLFVAVLWTVPSRAGGPKCEQIGNASWYGFESGSVTASGERFYPNGLTAAMPSRKYLGRVYRVHYGHKSVVVRVNDVGPAKRLHRVIDLSRGAAVAIGLIGRGVGTVCLERLP